MAPRARRLLPCATLPCGIVAHEPTLLPLLHVTETDTPLRPGPVPEFDPWDASALPQNSAPEVVLGRP